jgi:hypothetical protein
VRRDEGKECEKKAVDVQNTTAAFSVAGVETFNQLPVHACPQSFTTDFGNRRSD